MQKSRGDSNKLPKIDLSYKINEKEAVVLNDSQLLNKTAKKWADAIGKTKKTQARNFYDKILELQKNIKENGFDATYPFILGLNGKVTYARNRNGLVSKEFQDMMEQCLEQIKDNESGEQTFNNFQLFFEAVLGFFKGRN